ITYQPINDPGYEQDRVARTEPEAGAALEPGAEVVPHIAAGMVDVPDLRDQPIGAATEAPRERPLNARTAQPPPGHLGPGTVLARDRTGPGPRFSTIERTVAVEAPTPDPTTEEPTDEEPTPPDETPSDEPSDEPPGDGDGD